MFATTNFRKNLRLVLQTRKISQRRIAKTAKISYPYVNRILQGTVTPAMDICDGLADAVGVKLTDLLMSPKDFAREKLRTVHNDRSSHLRTA